MDIRNQHVEEIFQDWFLEVKKDLKKRASFWHPTLITNSNCARTVVLRALEYFDSENGKSPRFIIHTDIRSHKWQQLKTNPQAALHFYCPKRKWQMRIQGKVTLSQGDSDATIEWKRLSKSSQRIYSIKNGPGSLIEDPESAYQFNEDDDEAGYQNFGVLTVVPDSLESLQLERPNGPDYHLRAVWDLKNKDSHYLAP